MKPGASVGQMPALMAIASAILATTCGERDNQTVVEIIDNDPGISLENLSHIFKPFFTTKGVGSGKGLGLTISQGILGESTTVRSNSNQRQLKRDSSCDCRCCRLKETKAPAGTCSLAWQ